MKHFKLYLASLLFASFGFYSCDDNWDTPPLDGPQATIEANTTIAELKARYWSDDKNGVDTVEMTDDGKHIVIKGRVISSDASGNIYKNIVIQDETAAITLSINANSLYNTYAFGQELVIDATDMYIGKYSGLQQFGFPDYDEQFGWQTTFMPLEFFKKHVQLNGLPNPAAVDTMTIRIADLPSANDVEGVRKWQSQLVRFDNVHFVNGGKETFAEYQVSKSQTLTDGSAQIDVRTSGYANFYNRTLPEGDGSVVGILGYFNGSWQLTLRSYSDCIFDQSEGSKSNPMTVSAAISNQGKDANKKYWVKGYIVGAVAPGVSSVSSNSDIEWNAPFTLPNTLVIAESADVKDYKKCLVIELPSNSELRTQANLQDNPDNRGFEITLQGKLNNVLGMAGLTDNKGTKDEFSFDKPVVISQLDENFDEYINQGNDKGWIDISGSNLLGEGWTVKTVKGDKSWSLRSSNMESNVYATCTGYSGKNPPFDAWLISPAVNFDKMPEKVFSFYSQVNLYNSTNSHFEVYVLDSNDPTTANKTLLEPKLAQGSGSSFTDFVPSGNVDLSQFKGIGFIAFRYYSEQSSDYATWNFDNVMIGKRNPNMIDSDNDGSLEKPYTAAEVVAGITGNDKWVTGYIVGFVSGIDATKNSSFTAEGANNLNVLIAETADVKDPNQCVVIALPSGAIRDAINLKSHPENLGKQIKVKGNIVSDLYRIKGIKEVTEYQF